MKRLIFVRLPVLLVFLGLMTINCKSESEGKKTSGELNDSTFVEIIVKQGLMMREYQMQGQLAESDSARQLISDEFKQKMEKMLSDYGVSEEQFKSYAEEIQGDTQRVKALQTRIIKKTKKLIMEESENSNEQDVEKSEQ